MKEKIVKAEDNERIPQLQITKVIVVYYNQLQITEVIVVHCNLVHNTYQNE